MTVRRPLLEEYLIRSQTCHAGKDAECFGVVGLAYGLQNLKINLVLLSLETIILVQIFL